MPKTGKDIAPHGGLHRHKDSRSQWTKTTEEHTHDFVGLTAAEVAAVKLLLASTGGGGGTAPGTPNPPPDPPLPPVISNVVIGTITTTGATITWNTDVASTGVVVYGTTTAYGSTTSATSSGTSHSRTLSGLTAGTTYHLQVRATASGLVSFSSDRTFITAGIPVPPVPPDPPPPGTGTVILPGTGTIAAAIANGDRDLVLMGGIYKDSFGSTQRTDDCILRNYPGEVPIIDGTGLAQNFLYLGSGASWEFTGIKIQGFRPTDSGVIGVGAGSLILDAVTMQGLGGLDDNIHLVYCFGNGTTVIRRSSRLLSAPGAAITTYHSGSITPTVTITDSELTGLYRGGLFYDAGTISATNTRFFASSGVDIERLAAVPVSLTNCQGGGSGTPPAVRVVVT